MLSEGIASMNNRFTLRVALLAATVSCVAPVPASAASLVTDAFLTNANQDIDFLDRSSRLALQNSNDAKLKAFAYDQAKTQTLAANAIGDWIKSDLGPQTAQGDGVATGRSVAIDANSNPVAQKIAAMSPQVDQEDLDNLEGLTGKDFDPIYKARQETALGQLQKLYEAYASNGDDPTLVGLAKRELPKVKNQIVELRRL
jgi:hypothetical protein